MNPHQIPLNPDDDTELDEYIRRTVRSVYYYSSACRMAPASDTQTPGGGGVVYVQLRVHRKENLRVTV